MDPTAAAAYQRRWYGPLAVGICQEQRWEMHHLVVSCGDDAVLLELFRSHGCAQLPLEPAIRSLSLETIHDPLVWARSYLLLRS
jgi:hypothetical protein